MDADLEMQGAIVARLRADPNLAAIISGRVFDNVPKDADFPYVTYGPVDALTDDADCITGFDLAIQLHVWSRAVGYPESKRIADLIRVSLHQADDIDLPVNALALIEHRQTTTTRDPDGLTSHAIMQFAAFVERR